METQDVETVILDDVGSSRDEGLARSIYLAMLGAVGMAYDGFDETLERLIRRGEELQGELQGKAQEVRVENMRPGYRVTDQVNSVGRALREQLDIPSKAEIDAMNVKLNILMRKLDDLTMRQATAVDAPETPVTPPPVEPSEAT